MANAGALFFRDWNSVGNGNIGQFNIKNGADCQVWDITNQFDPIRIASS